MRDVLAVAVAVADLVAPVDDDLVDVPALLLDAGALDERAELRRRAVEDRHLALHLHEQIGDAVAVQRRQQVLDGLRDDAVVEERRRVAGRVDVVDARRNRRRGRDAAEDDAASRRERLQDEAGADAGVQALAVRRRRCARWCAAAHGACDARRAGAGSAAASRRRRPAPLPPHRRATRARGRRRAAARRARTASR